MAKDVASAALRAADRELFERQGYLQIPGVLSREECAGIVEVTRGYLPEAFRSEDPRDWRGRIQDCCNNIPLYQRKGLVRFKAGDGFASHPQVQAAIYDNPRVVALFEAFLGPELQKLRVRGLNPDFPFPQTVSLNELLGTRLDPEMRHGAWDRIKLPSPPQFPITGHLETHAVELGALIYLSDVGPDAGGVGVWPGSHRLFRMAFGSSVDFLPNRLYKRFFRLLQGRRPQVLEGRAGDLILFHNRLLHTNTINRSSDVRHALVVDGLGKDWRARAAEPQMTEDALNALGPARRLLRSRAVRDVVEALPRDHFGAFTARWPRLAGRLLAISKDPSGAGRNHLSAKIACAGRATSGSWSLRPTSTAKATSSTPTAWPATRLPRAAERRGPGQQPLRHPGRAGGAGGRDVGARFEGRFARDHYVRVIRTRQPFTHSEPAARRRHRRRPDPLRGRVRDRLGRRLGRGVGAGAAELEPAVDLGQALGADPGAVTDRDSIRSESRRPPASKAFWA